MATTRAGLSSIQAGTTVVSYGTEVVLATEPSVDGEIMVPALSFRADPDADFNEDANIILRNTDTPIDVQLGQIAYTIVQPEDRTAPKELRIFHKVRLAGTPPTNHSLIVDWAFLG